MIFQLKIIIFSLLLFLSVSKSFCQANDTIIDSRYTWSRLQSILISYYSDSARCNLSNYQRQTAILFINEKLALVTVVYTGFDNHIHKGQIICHKTLADDVQNIFAELFNMKFPVNQCKPICDFSFSDIQSMQSNNTNGFDFRFKTGSRSLSKHCFGLAIDINPVENPYKKGREILPGNNNENSSTGRIRITDEQGRKVISIFRKYGWSWGGNWRSLHDYMHFEKR